MIARHRVDFGPTGPPAADLPVVYEPDKPPAIPMKHFYQVVFQPFDNTSYSKSPGTVRTMASSQLEPELRSWVSKHRPTKNALINEGWVGHNTTSITLVPLAAAAKIVHDLGLSRAVQAAMIHLQQRASAAGAATQPPQPPQPLIINHHTGVPQPAHPQLQGAARAPVLHTPGGPVPPPPPPPAPSTGQAVRGLVQQPRPPATQHQVIPNILAYLRGQVGQPIAAQVPAAPSPQMVQQQRRCVLDLTAPPPNTPQQPVLTPPRAQETAGEWAECTAWGWGCQGS
jgi:hypothetical protein